MEEEIGDNYDDLKKSAYIGELCAEFFHGEVGKHLINRIDNDKQALLFRLKDMDPFKPNEILKLQMEIKMMESSKKYLLEAIYDGIAARTTLDAVHAMTNEFDASLYTNKEEDDFYEEVNTI